MNSLQACRSYLDDVAKVAARAPLEDVLRLQELVMSSAEQGSTLFVAGNGGSATVADHFALGMSLNVLREGGRSMRAISLCGSGSVLSGAINDFGYVEMFAAQLEVLGQRNDLFIGFSASGRSNNISQAVVTAGRKGLNTAVVVGHRGSVSENAGLVICLDTDDAAICEDVTIMLLHWVYGTFMGKP